MDRVRPLIIGMNNPRSVAPEHALYPLPEGCSGNRLWRMLYDVAGTSMRSYVDGFERRNLVVGEWNKLEARRRATEMCANGLIHDRHVLLLGEEVRMAFGLEKQLIHPLIRFGGAVFRQLPHPSGRTHWYNDPTHRLLAGLVLEEMHALV